MRHSVYGRKLSRTKNERRRLFAGLLRDLILHGSITTSVAKAKAIQPVIDKLITKAKTGSEAKARLITAALTDRRVTKILMDDAKTRFAGRTSGYTRIIKLGKRKSDATEMAMMSFVDEKIIVEQIAPKKAEKPNAKTEAKKEVAPKKEEKTEKPKTSTKKALKK